MPNMERVPTSGFSEAFAEMRTLVADATRVYMVKSVPEADSPAGVYPIVEVYERERLPDEAVKPYSFRNVDLEHCLHWRNDPAEVKQEPLQRSGTNLSTLGAGKGFVSLTPAWLTGVFGESAQNASQLAEIIAYTGAVAHAGLQPAWGGRFTNAFHELIVKSLDMLADPTEARTIITALKIPEAADYKRLQATTALGKLVLGSAVGSYSVEKVGKIAPQRITEAIKIYDAAGVIDSSLWSKFGLIGGGGVTREGFLPLLYDKLMSGSGPNILADIGSPQFTAATYITKLLKMHSEDKARANQSALASLKRSLPGDRRAWDTIDLVNLISRARWLTERYNSRTAEAGDELPKISRTHSIEDASVALMRILAITRNRQLSKEAQDQQFAHDMQQVQILSLLLGHVWTPEQASRSEILFQRPTANEAELQKVWGAVHLGVPLPEALKNAFVS